MSTTISLDILDQIKIASPCPKRWDEMDGDDRKRFCDDCRLNVYNLSAMTRAEAVDLLTRSEGRLCACFWRRADGTILTRDCPVGLATLRAKTAAVLRRVAAAAALLVGGGFVLGRADESTGRLRQMEPFASLCRWLNPAKAVPPPAPGRVLIVGKVAPMPPQAIPSIGPSSGSSGGTKQ